MKKFLVVLIFVFLIMGVQLYIDNNEIEITNFEIENVNIPKSFDGLKILQLSDLHSKQFGKDNINLTNKIDEINPDIIVMTGDMVNAGESDYSVFLDVAEYIGPKYETYYIIGNHEMDLSNKQRKKIEDTLEEYGIDTLDNEYIVLEKDNEKMYLYGMWYNIKYYGYSGRISDENKFTVDTMETILGKAPENSYKILLTHNPKHFEVYNKWGADLILTGHVHGGMLRIPFFGAVFSPDRTLFPKYSEGSYTIEESIMIVSRGLGRGLSGIRIWNRPELCVITLNSSN